MTAQVDDPCERDVEFPRCPANRPALPRIERRIGTYPEIRRFLFERLNQAPTLAAWTHREPDDPGIALLEGAAIVGDILTFYQELYANEAYLRTADWRESVSALVRLLGYRLSPGVGGRGIFAIEVRGPGPVQVPAEFPLQAQVTGVEDPVDLLTSDPIVAYPWLSRFSLCRPLTVPDIAAGTRELAVAVGPEGLDLQRGQRLIVGAGGAPDSWDKAQIVVIDSVRQRLGETLVTVRGNLRQVAPVHELMAYRIGRSFRHFGHNAPEMWVTEVGQKAVTNRVDFDRELATPTTRGDGGRANLDAVEMPLDGGVDDLTPGTTLICQVTPPAASAKLIRPDRDYRREATASPSFFGGGGGSLGGMIEAIVAQVEEQVVAVGAGQPAPPSSAPAQTARSSQASTASSNLVQLGFYGNKVDEGVTYHLRIGDMPRTVVRVVDAIRQSSLTWGSVTGSSAVVSIDRRITTESDYADIRNIQFHEATSPELRLQAVAVPTGNARGNLVGFVGTAAEAATLASRRLLLVPPAVSPTTVTVQSVEPASALAADARRLRPIKLDLAVDYAAFGPEESPVVVHGNVVDATQGKREREEPIGSGDARILFQTMELPKAPLTYLTRPGETPPETPELEVFVSGRRWRRVPSLFGLTPGDEVYIVREDDEGRSWVQFGDGKTGARVPSGTGNVVVRYRSGVGAFGPPRPDTSVQAVGRLERLDKVRLPGQMTGGDQPEGSDSARIAAPGKVQSLDRLVSLRDFETEAMAIAGVSRASAAWRLVDSVPAAVVTILMDTGRETEIDQIRGIVAQSDRRRGASRFPVIVVGGQRRFFALDLRVATDGRLRDAEVVDAIRAALEVAGIDDAVDGTAGRTFGEQEYATRLEGRVQNVTGVTWVRVESMRLLGLSLQVLPGLMRGIRRSVGVARVDLGARIHLVDGLGRAAPTRVLTPGADGILALRSADLTVALVAAPPEGDR